MLKISKGSDVFTDHWEAHEKLDSAKAFYKMLIKRDDVYSASICGVIESTDYSAALWKVYEPL